MLMRKLMPVGMLIAFLAVSFCLGADESSLQERISQAASDCSSPRVVMSRDSDIFVAWEGILEDRSRIFFRNKRGGRWGPETIIDRSPWGDNTDPAITLDGEGNPHIVWTFSDQETSSVHYAFRSGNKWFYPEALRQRSDVNCEFPDIAIQKDNNRVYVCWQEGRGSRYSIYIASGLKNGEFDARRLSRVGNQTYNIYPEIFIAPTPFVTWYGFEGSDFALRAALFNIQTQEWMRYDPAGLEYLPANRLPFLMSDQKGVLYATWYDSDSATDRIFFSRQGDLASGKGVIVDGNPDRMNSLPSGIVGADGEVYLCWRGESIFGGQIFFTKGTYHSDHFEFEESRLVSDGQKLFYTQPDCCLDAEGGTIIVWVSSFMDGGDGAVYYRRDTP